MRLFSPSSSLLLLLLASSLCVSLIKGDDTFGPWTDLVLDAMQAPDSKVNTNIATRALAAMHVAQYRE